ncbi:MAG: alpha/beta fold hydrolase [Aquincola sp.]|nr:alpha/beta fold hydrolase [Aquincola sp.]
MFIDVVDAAGGIRFPAEVMGWPADAAPAAPLPLAVLSHGNGGSYQIYRALCHALVAAGWVVAAFDHPGNHRKDDRLKGTLQNLQDRPRHVGLVISEVLARLPIDSQRIAVIGHSLGAYTALAVAGGQAHARSGEAVAPAHDARVNALVLLAPAAFFFQAPGALRAVNLPILLMEAEHDDITPLSQGEIIRQGVADARRVDSRVVPGAGHFSFITPFPKALVKPGFAPSQDPPGFDREAFHRHYPQDIVAWLNQTLPPSA